MDRPFIYIASLQRTGSTVLSEALTLPPHSFIFREPRMGIGRFELRGGGEDALTFMNYGIDLLGFKSRWTPSVGTSLIGRLRRKWSRYKRRSFVLEAFKNELVPQFASCLAQIGVKEIRHEGWRGYLANFPEMRVILTGRDPRDIFTSLYYRWKGVNITIQESLPPKRL